ncbi:MAG: hypothetical protein IKR37_03135 [Paludibacteraceae bacterium]|nr:hypothetical protein [Paludibacteraceae bacterium]
MQKYIVSLFVLLTLYVGSVSAQKVIDRSDKMPPRWVKHPPVSQTPGMRYYVVTVSGRSLRTLSDPLDKLVDMLPRDWEVTTDRENSSTIQTERTDGKITNQKRNDFVQLNVKSHGTPVQVKCRVIDTYWELRDGFTTNYIQYILYQVADPNGLGQFENVRLTTSYGAQGLYSILMPGASQFYKGSYIKGGCILGGSVLLAGGIVGLHTTSLSYTNLENSTHIAQHKQTYHTKAQNYMIGRNVVIGVLAGVYVYNVLDAFIAPGARRVVRTGGFTTQYTFSPTMLDATTPGLAMRINF